MDQEKRSLFQRIRNARQSLENAEKSFQDDRGMRGELDLMLAEAELKNLRNKQAVPWSWNRNVFALSIAILLCISGLCGWYFAKGAVEKAEAVPMPLVEKQEGKTAVVNTIPVTSNNSETNSKGVQENKKALSDDKEKETPQVYLSEKDMRNLVRSAKSELSSGK